MIATVLILHLVAAIAAPVLSRSVGRRVALLALLPPIALLAWLVTAGGPVMSGGAVAETFDWVPGLDLSVALRVDAFSALMLGLIAGLGVLILLYARSYLDDDRELGRVMGGLVGFAGAMAGLVVADDLLTLYLFWELTSITSYVLIAGDGTRQEARASAQHALIVTVGGGLAMLAGFIIVGQVAGTYRISELALPGHGAATVAGGLILLGAFTKSAQVPFHGWLPDAMVAPTPVSAYLHSATMVTAGVYLVARLSPVLADASVLWVPATAVFGLSTMVLAAAWALAATDLKRLLAYGTISQLGLMMALVGAGRPELLYAGIAVLVAHALYKSALFLVVGNIEHAAGTRDLRRLRGVARAMPVTATAAVIAAASMMGLPPLFGYVTKEAGLDVLTHAGGAWWVAAGVVTVGSILTVAYGLRFAFGGLTGRLVGAIGMDGDPETPDHELGASWTAPVVVLAALTLGAGLLPGSAAAAVSAAVDGLTGGSEGSLALWHGLSIAVGLSALAIGVGIAMHAASDVVARVWRRLPSLPAADTVFRETMGGTTQVAAAVTGVVQSGSLPVYLTIIASTALLLPASGLFTGPLLSDGVSGSTTPAQGVVAALLIAAAIGIAVTHRRFVALLFLGAVGLGMTALFWLQGAPDLALTQITIEIVSLMLFVLVLRRLPERFTPPRWAFGRGPRLAISVLVGAFVAGLAVLAAAVERPQSVSVEYLTRALPEADGHNVVNVILVDFRALDTLGEITVLAVAALGITELIGRMTREGDIEARVHPLFAREFTSPIAAMTIAAVYPVVLLASVYFLVAGHNHPGGGFVGGLVAGAALLLKYVTDGSRGMYEILPVAPTSIVASGLLLSVGTGIAAQLGGLGLLGATTWSAQLPVFGAVKASSTLVFDLGVYLIVVGFVANALHTFGAEEGTT